MRIRFFSESRLGVFGTVKPSKNSEGEHALCGLNMGKGQPFLKTKKSSLLRIIRERKPKKNKNSKSVFLLSVESRYFSQQYFWKRFFDAELVILLSAPTSNFENYRQNLSRRR